MRGVVNPIKHNHYGAEVPEGIYWNGNLNASHLGRFLQEYAPLLKYGEKNGKGYLVYSEGNLSVAICGKPRIKHFGNRSFYDFLGLGKVLKDEMEKI